MTSTVSTSLTYGIPPPDGVPAKVTTHADPATGQRERNFELKGYQVQVENIRGKEDTVSLDSTGFQFYSNRPSKLKSFTDEEEIKSVYYKESEELIKELTGASKVELFDHTVRRNYGPGHIETGPDNRQPAFQVHIDQTSQSAVARVHRHLPASEAPELLKRRFQIINLWRPIAASAFDWPLGLCDYRSVDLKEDVFSAALIYPDREGEIHLVKHTPNHRWKYVRGMTPDEFVLIKCFDSIQDGSVAVFTPHCAFQDPTAPDDAPKRQSIELRALVFYD